MWASPLNQIIFIQVTKTTEIHPLTLPGEYTGVQDFLHDHCFLGDMKEESIRVLLLGFRDDHFLSSSLCFSVTKLDQLSEDTTSENSHLQSSGL